MASLLGLLRTMRPKQWTKNVIIYAGLVFDGQLFNVEALLRVTVSFVLLCLAASTVYIINDLVDIERDKLHPKKKYRPLPSGVLSPLVALTAAIVLPVFSLLAAWSYSPLYALILLIYIVTNILYSFRLKHVVIIDVLTITAGYVLRVAGGAVVITGVKFSPWLYAVLALLALFLAITKRRQELLALGEISGSTRPIFREYNLALLDEMLRMVSTSTLVAYILYTIESPSILLANTKLALITVPFVLYGLFRYMYLIYVRGEGSAPDEVLLKDRPLQLAIMLWGLSFLVVLYIVPNILS
ncbi:MAG: decaprenyl-phosphate phosphoribosyltransferase [Chloroflexi bacterium]|nr:decaprenyl-phosphate phosphoribosyltransferase [Chloroflexota bacterium]